MGVQGSNVGNPNSNISMTMMSNNPKSSQPMNGVTSLNLRQSAQVDRNLGNQHNVGIPMQPAFSSVQFNQSGVRGGVTASSKSRPGVI